MYNMFPLGAVDDIEEYLVDDQAGRRTGNTFRQIAYAMIWGSARRQVFYITEDATNRDYAFRMAMQMVPANTEIGKDGFRRRINFPGGGFVEFLGAVTEKDLYDKVRGLEDPLVIQDHYRST